jgi:glycosyltransferase involved in cell wall biosynthesis
MGKGLPVTPRVALVHDFLLDLRGAERTFEVICGVYPDADVFTAVHDPVGTEGRFAHRNVHTTYLQRLHPSSRNFRALLPFYPAAIESLDLRGYDIVVSSSSAWAHGVIPDAGAAHLCYCHNPFRYAWNARERALETRNPITRTALRPILHRWRQWDWIAAQRVDRYVTTSDLTRARVRRYYGLDSNVLSPPVDTARFSPSEDGRLGDHYLLVSEQVFHKRIEVAIDAFNRLALPLVVVGDGPEHRRLRRMAGPTIRFTGRLGDVQVGELMRRCQALVVTAAEEFGIAAVEAQASGRPVIAYGEGGALETVIEGRTGAFYPTPTAEALAETVRAFDPLAIDPADCVQQATRFSADRFVDGLRSLVDATVAAPRPDRRERSPVVRRAGRLRALP